MYIPIECFQNDQIPPKLVVSIRRGPAQTFFSNMRVSFERAAEVRDSPKFFKILRIEIENYPIIIRLGMY
jgi:hypothetical protein